MDTKRKHQARAGRVTAIEHRWISMPDGVHLAARIWMPAEAARRPVPAILEYIPYRKRDMVRARDERNHPYFAAHGYACLRVDIRGSGDSEGHMADMYGEAELADARHVIDWIAAQPWCDGNVGMFGTSWGGTASLQAAVNAPDALKAVIANCATVDRFEDDIHWMGGALLTDSLEWGATLPAVLAAPPDAATVGDGWREAWEERLNRLSFPLDAWIRHRTRGSYWRRGSVRFAAAGLRCPVLAIGGWADRYANSVMRLVDARPDICWGIVGPWGHHYPDEGAPGPAIGFQDLALAWWDHWLAEGSETALDWPRLRLWRREWDPPADRLDKRSGCWIELADVGDDTATALFVTTKGLAGAPCEAVATLAVRNDIRHGECAGDTGYFGRVGGLPLEQSGDDARALCFDSAPLASEVDLIGHAEIACDITRDRAEAQLVCRLCEVTPGGRSHLVTRQVFNLALDEAMDRAAPFSAGTPIRYRLRLPSVAHRFAKGNRIRLALGTSYWPLVWPAPRPAAVQVSTDGAKLSLPTRRHAERLSVPFPKPRRLPARTAWESRSDASLTRAHSEASDGRAQMSWNRPRATLRYFDIDTDISLATAARYHCDATEPGSVSCTFEHAIEIRRPDGTARIRSLLDARTEAGGLLVLARLSTRWNGEETAKKHWRYRYTDQ